MSSKLYTSAGERAERRAMELVVTGNVVRELRTAKNLSQADLAAALGVSRQTVNSIETGRYTPSLPLSIALARFFGTTVEEVFHVAER
jgi:putative transcriptional regulator